MLRPARLLLLLSPLLLAACGEASAPPAPSALVILPDEGPLAPGVAQRDARLNFHDFGRVPDGDTVVRVFRLRNDGPATVAITRVTPGCGCTVPALRVALPDGTKSSGQPISSKQLKLLEIPPGAVGELELSIHTADLTTKNQDKLLLVNVATDAPGSYFLTFELHILVEKPFAVVPSSLALGQVPENGGKSGKVEIVRAGPFAHELVELLPPPAGVRAELTREERNFQPVWTLAVTLEAPLARGPVQHTLRLGTRDEKGAAGRELEVKLSAQVVGDLALEPTRAVLLVTPDGAGESTVELFSLLRGQRLRVTALELPSEHAAWLAAEATPVSSDAAGASERWRLTLRAHPPYPAGQALTGKAVVLLDDPQHPRHELEYVVHVR